VVPSKQHGCLCSGRLHRYTGLNIKLLFILDRAVITYLHYHLPSLWFNDLLQDVVELIKEHYGQKAPSSLPPPVIPEFLVPSHREPRFSCFVESEAAGIGTSKCSKLAVYLSSLFSNFVLLNVYSYFPCTKISQLLLLVARWLLVQLKQ
jgi:hypothetical protein